MEVSCNALKEIIKEHAVIRYIADQSFSGHVYLVGGAIREILLKKAPRDYDLALTDEIDLKKLQQIFKRPAFILGKKPIQTHRIITDDTSFDITIVKGSIEEDLKRRDFTMNAIAYDIGSDVVVDTLHGIEDIQNKIIRYPNKDSLKNDPLRMLKAIRHYATLDGFILDNELFRSIGELKNLIHETAAERIKYEMDHIVIADGVADAMKILSETGLLFELFPELYALRQMDIEKNFQLETLGHTLDGYHFFHSCNQRYATLDEKALRNVGYAFLFHDLGKAHTFSYDEEKGVVHFFYHERFSQDIALGIMEKLRFSIHEIKTILAIIESHMRIFLISNNESTEKAIRRLVYKMGDLTPSLILHTLCDMYGSSGGVENPSTEMVKKRCEEILNVYNKSLEEPLPRLMSGRDLIGLGFVQGPSIGKCLNNIREKQIAGEMTDRDQAFTYAQAFLIQSNE